MSTPPTPPAEVLIALADPRFPNLSQAEQRLLRAAPQGEFAVCGPNDNDDDPANDPAKADNDPEAGCWGADREVRADLIRWLCTDSEATKMVDPRGLRAYGAKVTGKLDLSFATIPFPLALHRCCLTSDSDFRYVKLPALYLTGTFVKSINMDGADVSGDIFFCRGFSAEGEVRLLGTQIGGDLDCSGGGTFKNPGGDALSADRINVKGGVFLRDNFSAEGKVRLLGAQIGSTLECNGGTFKNPGGYALTANSANIKGSVFLRDNFSAEGEVRLLRAQIAGSLQTCAWKNESPAILDLRETVVGSLFDDEKSWPNKGNLYLDGFVYQAILKGPTDARTRLEWLDRQPEFKPQPYRQLAKFLREQGDDDGARQVLFELERRTRAEDRSKMSHSLRRLLRLTKDAIFRWAVGYGIYPQRAIGFLALLIVAGWVLYGNAGSAGAMVPTEKDAYREFHDSGHVPSSYSTFTPFIYSLENCLPIVKFGQDDHWHPDPNPHARERIPHGAPAEFSLTWFTNLSFIPLPNWALSTLALRWFRWFMIAAGWFLATFFVAAVSGIIKPG